jgi:hypothetical protein
MRIILPVVRPVVLIILILAGFVASALAQEVSIPAPGLNTAIREALQKPVGPLTEPDLLNLTELNAASWNISGLEGVAVSARPDLRKNDLILRN